MTDALTRDSARTAQTARTEPHSAARTMLTKVPEATALFWVTKVLTTGMGETASDYFGRSPFVVVIVAVAAIVLVGSLVAQFRCDRYVPAVYWLAAAMISVFGTMAADVWHVGLGISYLASTITWATLLAVILTAWYRVEGTLSIHSITTRRREYFYWATVACTFALGTASGDMFASTLHLGYVVPGFMFVGLIALPALAHWKLGLNGVVAFWTAYVITRPLGASFSDWAAVSPAHRGLGFGPGPVSLVLTALILVALAFTRSRGSVRPRH